jgi:hypothetical protein
VEAVRAINSEVRDLLEAMKEGVETLNVEAVRQAANKARSLGNMLTPDAADRIQGAIDAARSAARKIVAAGEQVACEIDLRAVRAITEARTAFLDLDDAREVAAPTEQARAVDFEPDPVAACMPDGTVIKAWDERLRAAGATPIYPANAIDLEEPSEDGEEPTTDDEYYGLSVNAPAIELED